MTITIFHNPACGTSRNTLAMIRNSGVEPTVIEYLQDPAHQGPPARAGWPPWAPAPASPAARKGTPYAELDLANAKWTDDELLDFMLAHPILINRPVVETPSGTRLCRPSEVVPEILPRPSRRPSPRKTAKWSVNDKGQRI